MLVETYEEKELGSNSEIDAAIEDGELQLMIEELGLTGQESLFKSEEGEAIKPHGYRRISFEEKFVFETLFPNKTEITAYKDGIIPLRVLQVVAHVKSLNISDMAYFEIWHPKPGEVDPVLVVKQERWKGEYFILARWGSSLAPFEELKEKAIKITTEKIKLKFEEFAADLKSKGADAESYVRSKFLNGQVPAPYMSI